MPSVDAYSRELGRTISLAVRSVNGLNALSQYATDSRSAFTMSVLDFATFAA